jgi:hypothetical protein
MLEQIPYTDTVVLQAHFHLLLANRFYMFLSETCKPFAQGTRVHLIIS